MIELKLRHGKVADTKTCPNAVAAGAVIERWLRDLKRDPPGTYMTVVAKIVEASSESS